MSDNTPNKRQKDAEGIKNKRHHPRPIDRKNEIYQILGISSRSEGYDGSNAQNQDSGSYNRSGFFDSNKPTGAIFDNYSNYPKEPDNYWFYFRCYTIIGILSMAGFICSLCFEPNFSSRSKHTREYVVAEPEEDRLELVSSFNDNILDSPSKQAYKYSGEIYFKGKINNRYGIHMYINTNTHSGLYYYDSSGSRNCMKLNITDYSKLAPNKYILKMTEFDPHGYYCGEWEGTLSEGTYSGEGTYKGTIMPFNLTQCKKSDTNF